MHPSLVRDVPLCCSTVVSPLPVSYYDPVHVYCTCTPLCVCVISYPLSRVNSPSLPLSPPSLSPSPPSQSDGRGHEQSIQPLPQPCSLHCFTRGRSHDCHAISSSYHMTSFPSQQTPASPPQYPFPVMPVSVHVTKI